MKTVINGKIYDTDKAELIACGAYIEVYRTHKGNWFVKYLPFSFEGAYLKHIDANEAKSLVGLHAPERYDEFFGQAEEA